ncbi:MAG: hypothetical protein WA971_15760, partial [Microbacterium sp.]
MDSASIDDNNRRATHHRTSIQPIWSSALRSLARLVELGEPVDSATLDALTHIKTTDSARTRADIRKLLEPFVALEISVDSNRFETITQTLSPLRVAQGGWVSFLARISNPSRWTTPFTITGGGSIISTPIASGFVAEPYIPGKVEFSSTIRDDWWYELKIDGESALIGIEEQYFVMSFYSRDPGLRSAMLTLSPPPVRTPMGQDFAKGSSWSLVQRRRVYAHSSSTAPLEVEATPSREVIFDVRDHDGRTCVASLTVKDASGRVYPARGLRLAPDMFFHDHVYRGAGEPIRLPYGRYTLTATRGPEYLPRRREIEISQHDDEPIIVSLERWVAPAAHGYYSGDPHLHGGGCSHYSIPTQGVTPETMIRHARGEGLWMSNVLIWGSCYRYQRSFFSSQAISPPSSLEHPQHQRALGMTWSHSVTDCDHESHLSYDLE